MPASWIQRAVSQHGSADNSFTPTMPAGITTGNLLVMAVMGYHGSGAIIDTPSGWTAGPNTGGIGFSNLCRAAVFWKVAGASESAPTLTGFFVVIGVEISEVGSAGSVSASASGTSSSPGTIPTPASAAGAANSLAVYLAFENTSSSTFSAIPSGSTSRYNENVGGTVSFSMVWADEVVGSGAVAADSFTNGGSYNGVAHTLVIAPAAAPSPPVADFSGTPVSGAAPLSVAFTDVSTNTPTSWAWDFGDGGTSTSQNPTHNYTTPGTYDVELVATNAGGSDTETKVGYVTVGNPSGTFTRIKFGDGLVVTDEGGGVIRVDVA